MVLAIKMVPNLIVLLFLCVCAEAYITAELGEKSCPTGYEPIRTVAECKAAVATTGAFYDESKESVENLADDLLVCFVCEGCDPDSTQFGNDHGTLARYVCKEEVAQNRLRGVIACTESSETTQFQFIAGAEWELTEDWDCHGNDITSTGGNHAWDGSQDAFDDRAKCAQACLNHNSCKSFNYGDASGQCWQKHTVQKSTRQGTNCGSINNSYNFYTLLDKEPICNVPEWGITDASWNFVNKDDMSYSQTFFTNQDIEQMKDANVLKTEYIQCDLEFYVQRDDSESLTTFKFMRLSDQKIFSVNMKGKMTNHQHWKTGSDCKTLICYDYEQSHPRYSGYCPKDFYDGTTPLEVPVLLLEVNFNPTSSYSDKWRNKWTLEGSEYYVRSKPRLSPKTYLYIANGKCGNNAQTGDTFDVASAKECRDSCDLNFHETYFSILTTEESPLSCTCYNDCDANSRRADANSEIYEVLSVHVSEILHDTELVNEKLEYDLAICTHSAQDVNNNLAVCQTEFTTCEESKQDVNINLAVCQSDLTTCEANKIALTDEKTLWKGRFEAVETLETEFNSNTFTNQAKVQLPGAEASIADTMSGVMQPHLISTVEKVGYVLFGVLLSSVFMWGTKKSKRDENLALLDCE